VTSDLADVLGDPHAGEPGWRESVNSHFATLDTTRQATRAFKTDVPPRFASVFSIWDYEEFKLLVAAAEIAQGGDAKPVPTSSFPSLTTLSAAIDAGDVSEIKRAALQMRIDLMMSVFGDIDIMRIQLNETAKSCPSWIVPTAAPTP